MQRNIFSSRNNNSTSSKEKENNFSNKFLKSTLETKFKITDDMFPELCKSDFGSTKDNNKSNFMDIVTKSTVNESIPEDNLEPGWLKIFKKEDNISFEYGPLTDYQIKINELKIRKTEKESDLNYLMNNAVKIMEENWMQYEKEYDDIHGDGAYNQRFGDSYIIDDYDEEFDNYENEYDNEEEDGYYDKVLNNSIYNRFNL